MQTRYSSMMEAARQVVEHADEINATADRVLEILEEHKNGLDAQRAELEGTFAGVHEMLKDAETRMRQRLEAHIGELEAVIAAVRGGVTSAPEVSNG